MKKKKIISEITNKSISEKIYPSGDILKETVTKYLGKKYLELFDDWTDQRWSIYYKLNIATKVSFTELHYNLDISIINN